MILEENSNGVMPFYVPVIKKICTRIYLTGKNPMKIVQKKYISVFILWLPQNTQTKSRNCRRTSKLLCSDRSWTILFWIFRGEQVLKLIWRILNLTAVLKTCVFDPRRTPTIRASRINNLAIWWCTQVWDSFTFI